jgi:GrpB-like predicted nucleotidyltransferase (UPF0157 family)
VPDPVLIREYDQRWPIEADALGRAVADALGGLADRIEHVGSTAVPGLAAKPILDLDIVLAPAAQMPEVIAALRELGYRHEGDLGIEGREAFSRADDAVPWTSVARSWMAHHLYACDRNSQELARHFAFRDHLRRNTDDARRYASLKRELAERFRDDRDGYCEAKTSFVEDVLRRAAGHAA